MNEATILRRLQERPDLLPPVDLSVVEPDPRGVPVGGLQARGTPDAVVQASWSGRSWRFAAQFRRLGTPKLLQEAMGEAQRIAQKSGLSPLVVVPYLSKRQLDMLAAEGASGIDLCGNGILQVAGQLLVCRRGEPNAYPASTPIRRVYQGSSSIVARVFLLKPRYASVGEVLDEIERRGGKVSVSTVSKVLKALAEDLMIRRDGRSSRLLQGDELLDKLADRFQRPRVTQSEQFRWKGRESDFAREICAVRERVDVRAVVTGAASVNEYAVMPREKTIQFYCSDLNALTAALGQEMEPARRFADIELLETEDQLVYFDARVVDGIAFASPVQCWLELQAGDKREREAAQQVRQRILTEIEIRGEGTI